MKKFIFFFALLTILIIGCVPTQSTFSSARNTAISKNDTIRIANDSLEYEVLIIDPQFSTWLDTRAYPRNFHSLSYLENKNQLYVREWNNRVIQSNRYSSNLYGMTINYDSNIRYGYEVNYLIYNYMIYFQNTFRQKLSGYVPMQ